MQPFRILIADDHPEVRRALRALLATNENCAIIGEAVDGREAVTKATSLRPDLILLDIGMPFINGLEAAHQILQQNRSAKILVVTVHAHEDAEREARKIGVAGFIAKGDLGRDLHVAIEAIQNGHTFFATPTEDIRSVKSSRQPVS